ncbi:TPA: LysE family translocator [Pseudomonas aeruginosa]|uniref:LysE family translocator n=1 Tax=Pseudomonas aeruginosa TaxID=287 RepID=UPI00053E534B|nr:LysE family translocator [Pseudomonas aeruginosa]
MFAAFVLVASTHFAALLSPGPDFFLLVRAALLRGRRQADGVAAGIALANLLSMLLVLGLLASVPDSAHSALRWLQALGGLYFLWLAGQALLAQRRLEMPAQRDVPSRGGYLRGLRDGLLASSLNPKLPIFYAGLFGVLARFSLPGWALALCLAWMSLAVLCWDMALVRLLDRPRWCGWLQRRVGALDRLCGVLLLALGGWLVLAAL